MKNLPRLCLSLASLLAVVHGVAAVNPTEWSHRQPVAVPAPGLVRVAVPAATFDHAQPGLADLRLLDPQGREVAYLLDRDPTPRAHAARFETPPTARPKSFESSVANDTSQLLIETGLADLPESITLETSTAYFLKAAHVEVSSDGQRWESTGPASPVFRQFGAERLRLPLPRRKAGFVRVTLDDFRSRRVAFDGASLQPAPARAEPPPTTPVGAVVARRDEFAGETVLTVALDGARVPLACLRFEVKDPLFMRRVTVAIREVEGDVPSERVVSAGTIYRVALDGAPAQAGLEVPLDFSPPARELLVHIHNGDSPPLAVDGVQAAQHPVNLLFLAEAAGSFTLLSGNPQAVAPRYDLAAFRGEMRAASAASAVPGPLEPTPHHRPRDTLSAPALPEIPLTGAPLDTRDWASRRTVSIARAGVQELELDPAALAGSRSDFADLRLLRAGNQIPYVLEQPGLARALSLPAVPAPDPKRPTVSRWKVALPHAGVPLRRMVLSSATPLFSRDFRIYETIIAPNGVAREVTLAAGNWNRTPEPGVPETRTFELNARPLSDTLWIETDNGDNPAIALAAVRGAYPVARLVFKVAEPEGCTLAYGNPAAGAPRYDLRLVASRLLTASRNPATLDAADTGPGPGGFSLGRYGGYIFWAALGLVVIVLLAVVAKLLPKPPAT